MDTGAIIALFVKLNEVIQDFVKVLRVAAERIDNHTAQIKELQERVRELEARGRG
jgi:hypothetical protein